VGQASRTICVPGVLLNSSYPTVATQPRIGSFSHSTNARKGAYMMFSQANDVATAAQMVDGVSLQSSAGAADDAAGRTSS